MAQKKQDKGTGQMVAGGGLTAYGAANAPVLRGGKKDMSQMVGASPKRQGARYQAELHQAMKTGKVETDSPVHVLRTPSGRHINAGGTHRHIARQAMGKPSQYEVKDISHELHVSPAAKLQGNLRLRALKRGSKRAEAGQRVKPVGNISRNVNHVMAEMADINDAHLWSNTSALSGPAKAARGKGLVGAGMIAGTGAMLAAGGHAKRKEWKKTHPVSKARSMSDAELRRRQKVQGKIARTTSTLGLTGLAVTGAGALAARNKGALRAVQKIPKMKNATPEKMKNAAINTGIVSGGIGGVGGFNQASIYSAESRRRKQAVPVKKNLGLEMGYFGEEGHALTHQEIETEIEKAWEPVARNYDPEAKRHARSKRYETGLTAASGGAAAGAVVPAVKAGKLARKNSKISPRALRLPSVGAAHAARKASAVKSGKVAAGLAGGSAAAAGASALVHRGRKNSWQSYEKRDATSAFGVDHSDNPNGQHRETEN